jgi:tetratricopeptide (TPR) repeat protein
MAHWVNARIAEKKKDHSSAEREYRALIETTRGSAFAWLNLGIFYKRRGRFDAMEEALRHVRSAPVDHPDALVDAAEILIRTGRNVKEATLLLETYLRSRAKVEEAPAFKAYYLLGTAKEQLGDKRAAAAEYRSALALAKDFQPAQEALARLNR